MTTKKTAAAPQWVHNMQRLMVEQNLNPRSLSLRAGLNATAVRDMIEGRSRFPRYDTVQALADTLQTTPAVLMSDDKTAADIKSKGALYGKDIELLTEIIARLQETIVASGRETPPQEFAAISASIYRKMQDSGENAKGKNRASIRTQIHDLLEYESLRHKRVT